MKDRTRLPSSLRASPSLRIGTFARWGMLAVVATGLAIGGTGCSNSATAETSPSDLTSGQALTVESWKELGYDGLFHDGKIYNHYIVYPHFVERSPTSAAGVINAKLDTAFQQFAAEQGPDVVETNVACFFSPGSNGSRFLAANIAGLLSLHCAGHTLRARPGLAPERSDIAKSFNFRIVGDTVSEIKFADVFTSDRALQPIIQRALDRDPRLTSTSERKDLDLMSSSFSQVPFHFETTDDSQTATGSLVHPLPAIYFDIAVAAPEITQVRAISLGLPELTPALRRDGPASLFPPAP